jgi:hypothetical protein
MRPLIFRMTAAGLLGLCLAGCHDNSPPPARVPVPSADNPDVSIERDAVKPLPPQYAYARPEHADQLPPRRIEEVAQPTRAPAGEAGPAPVAPQWFVESHTRVGRPRVVVFVNRTTAGALLPANGEKENVAPAVSADDSGLHAGDYDTIESAVADYFGAGGAVDVLPPATFRSKLADTDIRDLQNGHPTVMTNVAQQGDVLVQIQPNVTRANSHNALQLAAQALNTRGGALLGRATVDVPSPWDRGVLERSSRELASRLSQEMSAAWAKYPPAPVTQPATMPTTNP